MMANVWSRNLCWGLGFYAAHIQCMPNAALKSGWVLGTNTNLQHLKRLKLGGAEDKESSLFLFITLGVFRHHPC